MSIFRRMLRSSSSSSPSQNAIRMTFPRFSELPTELRNQIWHDTLPDKIGSAAYFYNRNCWTVQCRTEADLDYDHSAADVSHHIIFREASLDPVCLDISMLNVNQEARDIAVAWVRQQGLRLESCRGNKNQLVAQCLFDRTRDAVYLAPDFWYHFGAEPQELLFSPQFDGRSVETHIYIQQIALPQSLLADKFSDLPELLDQCRHITTLFVVAGPQPKSRPGKAPERWELEPVHGGGFIWDVDQDCFVAEVKNNRVKDKELYELLDKIRWTITAEPQPRTFDKFFTIRPVHMVERGSR
ncbi:hypothetical protein K461DRAFT_274154 [Myriangium duriaei CBS 260.36]|uniref:2EXR domain-containing protein n=1 Tax=Myriangium duriaei CBS 260.36 TaxID=1168546 RepID=A0A9P4JE32_9PEZI|nr:hypothetical protein K461DRAFT_274154 [Myriangium duriaei CBS 260.36]